jgi:hypothetical protein
LKEILSHDDFDIESAGNRRNDVSKKDKTKPKTVSEMERSNDSIDLTSVKDAAHNEDSTLYKRNMGMANVLKSSKNSTDRENDSSSDKSISESEEDSTGSSASIPRSLLSLLEIDEDAENTFSLNYDGEDELLKILYDPYSSSSRLEALKSLLEGQYSGFLLNQSFLLRLHDQNPDLFDSVLELVQELDFGQPEEEDGLSGYIADAIARNFILLSIYLKGLDDLKKEGEIIFHHYMLSRILR